jgi:nucleotide-binding universal stress UspA family protein
MHRRGDRGGRTTCLQACTPSKPSLELKPNSTRRSGTLVEAPAVVSLTEDAAMIALERILIPTDFSEPSDVALTYGLELARAFRATAIVIHVVKDRFARVFGDGIVVSTPELQADHENSARRRLDVLLHGGHRDLPEVQTTVIVSSAPADAIAGYARDADIDLIVIGTHGRGGMAHFLLGSVAERVVRIAPCPVLTVRHPEHEFVLPDKAAPIAHVAR